MRALDYLARRKYFILATGFLVLNGYAVHLYSQRNAGRHLPEEVRAALVSPRNNRVASMSRDLLKWRFSADMVSGFGIGKWFDDGPVHFSPAVPGFFCWSKPDELVFRPRSGWPGCTEFAATFAPDLRSLDLAPLTEQRKFTVKSDALNVRRAAQSDFTGDRRAQVYFEFTDEVSTEQLRAHLKIATPGGMEIPYRIHDVRSARAMNVALDEAAPGNEIVASISAGLQSTSGPLGLKTNTSWKIALTRELRLQHASPERGSFASGSVQLTFNAPLDLTTAAGFIKIRPHVDFAVDSCGGYGSRHQCRLSGAFRPGMSYTLTFAEGLRNTDGGRLEHDETRTVYFPDARPQIEFAARGSYMSPRGRMTIPLRLINVKHCTATIRRVYSNNLVQLAARQAGRYEGFPGAHHQGISQNIAELEMNLDSERNEPVCRDLDLGSALQGKSGAFSIRITADQGRWAEASHFFVVSDIGLTVKRSQADFLVWANSLRTLAPLSNATVRVFSLENQLLAAGETDEYGMARLDPGGNGNEGEPFIVTAGKDDDLTFLRLDDSPVTLPNETGSRPYLDGEYEAYVFTDRGIYRPGETARLKIVVRGKDASCPEPFPVRLSIYRPDGKTDRTLNALLGEYGTAELEIPWPDYIPTGNYRLEAAIPGAARALGETAVAIEEFVPPQIVSRLNTSSDRLSAAQEFDFEVSSENLFGGPAAGLPVEAGIDFMPDPFTAPQWQDYVFGDARREFRAVRKALGAKRLDANGKAIFHAAASPAWRPPAAIKALVAGTVTEMSGRAVSACGSRIIDIYPFYIGIRNPVTVVRAGDPHSFDIVTVRPTGAPAGAVAALRMSVEKLVWSSVLRREEEEDCYRYCSEEQAVPMTEREVRLKDGAASIEFTPPCAGRYRLSVFDPISESSSSLDFYAGDPGQTWTSRSMESPDTVELELDRKTYVAGDTATLTIRSPFAGKALLTVESDRILLRRVLDLTNNTAQVRLEVEPGYSPNVYCSVSVIRPAVPEEPWGQHRAAGLLPLVVENPSRRLQVKMELPAEIRPMTKLQVPVRVTDSAGNGCKTEVVLAAVDEGICALTAFASPDPYGFFFAPRLPAFSLHDLYAALMPELTNGVAGMPSEPGGGMPSDLTKRLNPVNARRFKPVALWSSTVTAGDDGNAEVSFDVPEFTGRLRIMAAALDKSRFGSADRQVLVRRPLVVQSSLPRFLAPSDSCVMPVRIVNETGKDGSAEVVVSCGGPLVCRGSASAITNTVALSAGAATNLAFDLSALPFPGKAVCRLSVGLGPESFSEETEIAVRPAAALVVLSGSGVVKPDENRQLNVPSAWLANTENTEVCLSPMPSVKLGGSIDYLMNYPYGCLEQTTSKSFPLLYLADLAEQASPGWLGRDSLADFVNAGIHRILSMQRHDGSFTLWPGCAAYVWGSVYATHFLVEAGGAGYAVPREAIQKAIGFLAQIACNQAAGDSEGAECGLYDRSYACFVLALARQPQHGCVARLTERKSELDRGSEINLAAALVAGGRRRDASEFLAGIGATPAALRPRDLGGSLRSAVRDDAILLSTLLSANPEHELVPVLAGRLDAAQTNGRWYTTQENAMALMALGKYCSAFNTRGKTMTGSMSWNRGIETREFENRPELRVTVRDRKDPVITILNRGKTPVYYCWKSEGVPADGRVEETDAGLRVRRSLLTMDGNPANPLDLRQGELLVMKTTLLAPGKLENVVVEDLLPAGLEIENANLKTSQAVNWIRERQNLALSHMDVRDDRLIAFPGSFSGEQSYYYALRAVTAGEYVCPAISASCMYDPDIRSVHGRARIRVNPAGETP